MKKFTILLASIAVVGTGLPAAAIAAPAASHGYSHGYSHVDQRGGQWQNINGRKARIEARINQGIRSGALTRREATQLRSQFNQIVRLEQRYRASRPGLTNAERRDLDNRFDRLERSIRVQSNDRDHRGPGHRR